MSDHPELPPAELEELVNQFLDDTLSDEGMQQLDRALDASPAARAYFLQFMQMHIEIGEDATVEERADRAFGEFCRRRDRIVNAAAPIAGGASEKMKPHRRGGRELAQNIAAAVSVVWGRTLRRPAVVFAAGALTAVLCYATWLRLRDSELAGSQIASDSAPAAEGQNPTVVPVARLTYTNGCTWGGMPGEPRSIDSQVRLGDEITLHEGIAEFRLSSGVSLSIEGPAALVLTSPTSLVLQHGRITVHVPSDIANFRLVAAGCRITCRAAEFGIQLAGGDVDIHTFSGQIEAAPAHLDERTTEIEAPPAIKHEVDLLAGVEFSTVEIEAERGLELTSQGDDTIVSRWHAADESQFATKLTMAGVLPISRAYPDAVLKSKPLAYWRFEKVVDGLIPNELGSVAPLAISGKVNFVGKANNRAVELGRPEYEGAMYCRNEFNLPQGSDYSVEAWMKPSHVHNGGIVGLVIERPGEPKEATALYVAIMNRAGKDPKTRQRLRFLHRDPPGSDSKIGTDCYSNVPYRVRRWQHIVAVKQGPEMSLYLDGVLVDKQHDESSLADHLCLIVGQLGISRCICPYIGQLDELAIYGRALTPEEIATHFKLVGPEQQEAVETGKKQI